MAGQCTLNDLIKQLQSSQSSGPSWLAQAPPLAGQLGQWPLGPAAASGRAAVLSMKQLQSSGPSWLVQAPPLAGQLGQWLRTFNNLIKQLQSSGPSWLAQAPPLASWASGRAGAVYFQ